MQLDSGLFVLAYMLILLGLMGAILPVVPGPLLIWLGVALWAWADGYQAFGWPTLLLLAIIAVLALGSDLLLTTIGSRKAGAGWKSVVGAILFGIVGGVLLSGMLPLVGSLAGTVLGAVFGIILVEYLDKRDWGRALRASRGYLTGYLAANALELLLSLLMIAIFAWQAFL
jgi:uncharacterized protein YqgC (DUF456 family)